MSLFGTRFFAGRVGADRPTTGGSRADRSLSAVTSRLVDPISAVLASRRVRNGRLSNHTTKCMRKFFFRLHRMACWDHSFRRTRAPDRTTNQHTYRMCTMQGLELSVRYVY